MARGVRTVADLDLACGVPLCDIFDASHYLGHLAGVVCGGMTKGAKGEGRGIRRDTVARRRAAYKVRAEVVMRAPRNRWVGASSCAIDGRGMRTVIGEAVVRCSGGRDDEMDGGIGLDRIRLDCSDPFVGIGSEWDSLGDGYPLGRRGMCGRGAGSGSE